MNKKIRKQPKYNFFKNWGYAISGFFEVLKNETAIKIELLIFILVSVLFFFLKISLYSMIIMIFCFFIVIIVELINSSIERCVDLVTDEYHILAKYAKDSASAAVMIANFLTTFVCLALIVENYIK